jgi:hypothetical protein
MKSERAAEEGRSDALPGMSHSPDNKPTQINYPVGKPLEVVIFKIINLYSINTSFTYLLIFQFTILYDDNPFN